MNAANSAQGERDPARVRRVEQLRDGGAAKVPELLLELVEPTWAIRRAVVAALAEIGQSAVEPLCQALRSLRGNEAQIAGAVDALVALRGDVEEQVLALLADENPAVVCDAAQILGRRASSAAVAGLSRLVAHENDNVALAAIEALGRIGGPGALDALLPLAESGNFFRAFPAIDSLGRSGDARAIPVLSRLLSDPLYGPEAVRALGRLADPSAIAPLVSQLSRANESMVRAIAVALAAIHERSCQRFASAVAVERALQGAAEVATFRRKMLDSLVRADPAEQIALGQVLSWIGEESTIPALLALLDVPGAVADSAVGSLKRLVGSAERALVAALRDASSARRRLLLPILAGRISARDEFVACLADEDPAVRALACDGLARTSDPAPVPALFGLLTDGDLRVSQAALAAIQSLGSAETKRLALAAVRHENIALRCAALRIIGYFAYPEAFDDLVAAASDPDERVRVAAIAGLPLMDDRRALDAIQAAFFHTSSRTRNAAIRALGQLPASSRSKQALLAALGDADPWVRYYACQGLGRLRDESTTEAVAALLGDGSGQVRVAAVEALTHLRGERAFEVLVSLLGSEDPDLFRAALVGLGISKRREALAPLLRAAESASVATRLVALSALAELGMAETVPVLVRAAGDSDLGVRTAAEAFLADHAHPSATSQLIQLLAANPASEALLLALARPAPSRVEAITAALQFADDMLASALIAALSRMQTESANTSIREALGSPNDSVRRAAAMALIASGDPLGVRGLEQAALNDRDPEVRRICAATLAR